MLVNYLPHNTIYKEPSFEYKPIPNENIIKGFFQSPKYFEHNWDKLKNYLTFTKRYTNTDKNDFNTFSYW